MSTPDEEVRKSGDSSAGEEAVGEVLKWLALIPAKVLNSLLLHRLRQPLSSIIAACLLLEVLLVGVALLLGGIGAAATAASNLDWQALGVFTLLAYLMVGILFTPSLARSDLKKIFKDQRELRQLANSGWAYQFQYRRSPWGVIRRRARVRSLHRGMVNENRTSLGLQEATLDGEVLDAPVYRYLDEAATHTLITGTTGSGKTLTMLQMMRGDMLNHRTLVVVDFKNDPKVAATLARWSNELGMGFYHFSSAESYAIPGGNQCYWDPFAIAGKNGKPDRIVDLRRWDDASEHYRTSWETAATNVFAMLDAANHPNGDPSRASKVAWGEGPLLEFRSAIRHGKSGMTDLVDSTAKTPAYQVALDFQNRYTTNSGLRQEVDNIQGILDAMVERGYGKWMCKGMNAASNIDLFKLTSEDRNVILFSLDSDDSPRLAGAIGSMLMADLNSVTSLRREAGCRNNLSVYIDEAQSVLPEKLEGLFTKARSSRLSLTIAQQSLDQIVAKSEAGESFLRALLDTIANFVVQAGSTEDTGERLSKILGKTKRTRYTGSTHAGGASQSVSFGDEEEWVVRPSEFVGLSMPSTSGKAEAIIVNKACADPAYKKHVGPLARKVWMIPCDEVLTHAEANEGHGHEGVVDGLTAVEPHSGYDDAPTPDDAPAALPAIEPVKVTVAKPVPKPGVETAVRTMVSMLKTGSMSRSEFSKRFEALTGVPLTKESLAAYLPPKPTVEEQQQGRLPRLMPPPVATTEAEGTKEVALPSLGSRPRADYNPLVED